jgi:hypothetical protein
MKPLGIEIQKLKPMLSFPFCHQASQEEKSLSKRAQRSIEKFEEKKTLTRKLNLQVSPRRSSSEHIFHILQQSRRLSQPVRHKSPVKRQNKRRKKEKKPWTITSSTNALVSTRNC